LLSSSAAILVMAAFHPLAAQNPGSLKTVVPPKPPNLARYVRDEAALVALGKALFWDMQLASDGRTACATCHFHAGADHRLQNQLSNPQGVFAPNYTLTAADFPFHLLENSGDNRSAVLRDLSQRAGSAGVFRRLFLGISPGASSDDGADLNDLAAFSLAGLNVRQVTPRNSPTVINSVFFVRNFWDGRASDIFTGLTPFGDSDTRQNAFVSAGGRPVAEAVRIENSSLASQAVGPALNSVEMSYQGRTWPQLGRKMLSLRPLALQKVAASDGVLGPLSVPAGRGLARSSYLEMVQAAFQPEYWQAPPPAGEFTQPEANFALFFGLAVQAYESTLVSDDSPFDRFSEGDSSALTPQQQAGLQVFRTRGQCAFCHTGPEFSAAGVTSVSRRGPVQRRGGNAGVADTGFFRTGVRPIAEDPGLDGTDDFGRPFSLAAALGLPRLAIGGAFKTPTLRNVEFTGPYFHNGGAATLEQVMEFYSRGGDFPDGGNLGPGIRRLNLSPADRAALVAFMKALSDDRVRFERAPFDHPELCIPVGQLESAAGGLQPQTSGGSFALSAADKWALLPEVGREGNTAPLQTFEELLAGAGADGSRVHSLAAAACALP
jgi:cytochrome c peroxidase